MRMSQNQTQSRSEEPTWRRAFPRLLAFLGCYCIHVGLTLLLLFFCMVAFGLTETLAKIVIAYFLLGWIPLTIWLYPRVKNSKIRWI